MEKLRKQLDIRKEQAAALDRWTHAVTKGSDAEFTVTSTKTTAQVLIYNFCRKLILIKTLFCFCFLKSISNLERKCQ